MSEIARISEPTYLPVPDVAELLRIPVTKVHQLVRDRSLVAIRIDGAVRIPAEFIQDDAVLKGLAGTITLLTDAGYSDEEIIGWLFAVDESLGGSAIGILRDGQRKEVHRRAQAAGF